MGRVSWGQETLHHGAQVPAGREVARQLGTAHWADTAPMSQPPALCQEHPQGAHTIPWPQGQAQTGDTQGLPWVRRGQSLGGFFRAGWAPVKPVQVPVLLQGVTLPRWPNKAFPMFLAWPRATAWASPVGPDHSEDNLPQAQGQGQELGTQGPSTHRHTTACPRCAHWGQEVALGSHPEDWVLASWLGCTRADRGTRVPPRL